MSSSSTRRQILAVFGATLTGGCLDLVSSDSDSGVRLGSFRIANTTDEEYTVDLWMERNNQGVYDETVEVAANDEMWIEPTWSSEPAEYDVYYTVSGTDEVSTARLRTVDESRIDGECAVGDMWILGPEAVDFSIVFFKDSEDYEEAECNF